MEERACGTLATCCLTEIFYWILVKNDDNNNTNFPIEDFFLGATMSIKTSNKDFKQGLASLGIRNSKEAARAFRAAYNQEPLNAYHISYYGLTLVLENENIEHGIALCREAVKSVPFEPEFYHNLSRAYLKGGQRKRALATLHEGLAFNHNSKLLKTELAQVNLRRKPFFNLLSRNNFLNQIMGRVTYIFVKNRAP
jgi:tetratricopeptide (TPR) repeat protein